MRVSRMMLCLLAGLALAGCGARPHGKLHVIATTSHLSQLAQKIGGEHVEAITIIPPGGCPGHYDVRPRDVQAAADGGLLLRRGWEVFTDRLVEAAGSRRLTVATIREQGHLMIPTLRAKAAGQVGEALAEADAKHAADYRRRARRLAVDIRAEGRSALAQARADGLVDLPAIAADQQAPFLRWLGLRVVGEYGRPEDLAPRSVRELLDAARSNGVRLVVDNLQSGPDAGRQMAEELGAARVTLSNFPGASERTPDWRSTLRANIAALARAAKA